MMAPLTTATLPLHSWRMRASFFGERWRRRSFPGRWLQPVDLQRARLRATVETNAAAGAAFPRVARGMYAISAQFPRQFQAFGRAGFHAQAAPLALLDINGDLAPRCHVHLVAAAIAAERCNHLVRSQYWYNSSRNLGWAISISALARSRTDFPCR